MKYLVVLCLALAAVCAEPPRFRNSRLRSRSRFFARQELAPPPAEEEPITAPPAEEAPYSPASAPYPPSGFKPAGEPFELPTEREEPNNAYGAPAQDYGTPGQDYGTPAQEYGPSEGSGDENATNNPDSENIATPAPEQTARLRRIKSQRQVLRRSDDRNSFYVLLPDNTLQRFVVPQRANARLTRF